MEGSTESVPQQRQVDELEAVGVMYPGAGEVTIERRLLACGSTSCKLQVSLLDDQYRTDGEPVHLIFELPTEYPVGLP